MPSTKGQSTIEFLGGMFIVILALVAALSANSGKIPEFESSVEQSARNMEIYSLTEKILSKPGYHTNGTGGTEWEDNISHTSEFGLAKDYLVLEKEKIDALQTTGDSSFNYSQFKKVTGADNQYHFTFIWQPIVETSNSFTRTEPENGIDEPGTTGNPDPLYSQAENRVHYGNFTIQAQTYWFLVTAHDGVYNTTRISTDKDFDSELTLGTGDTYSLAGTEFELQRFQNRERKPGAAVVLSNELKSFGPSSENVDQSVTKLNRYAVLEEPLTDSEPIRIEVLSW
ncbi:hypothetical protein [Candidatus Nanohalobium constans]|uniref:Uncharacterized protein n=1 Tax=Candidatus Nanohalobium constans TaxID=2565781 RepID=A0A5Q0UFF6_9ARCH|nr:hypothetical protein [Candidatus Nanohalobium constans]QGA80254.1 hypothetical protein LC1Nh_0353 [Candidatus Nanohalobium constans]